MTPMMQQYFEIKNQYPDYILMYRLGDFYEMFYEDAQTASAELDLTLTGRDCGEEDRAQFRIIRASRTSESSSKRVTRLLSANRWKTRSWRKTL